MEKLSTKIVHMLCEKGVIPLRLRDPISNHPTRSEIINMVDAVIDLHIYETDDERSIRITEFLDDADAGLILTEDHLTCGKPIGNVRYDDGGYELQVISFDNRWAKMRILDTDEIIFVPPNKLKHYIIINE